MKVITFKLHQETKLPKNFINAIPKQGKADSYVDELLKKYRVKVSLEDSREFLKSYGAWDEEELSDLESNIQRLVWLACLDCQENKTTYFYMGI